MTVHFVYDIGDRARTTLAEPVWRATGGAGPSGPTLSKTSTGEHRVCRVRGLLLEAGVFLSPIAPKSIPVKDQWNCPLEPVLGPPFHHSGIRATYPVTEHLSLSAQLYNGWNSITTRTSSCRGVRRDVHGCRSGHGTGGLLLGGVERPEGAPEGAAWRHLFDAYATITVTPCLQLLAQADAGFENNRFGTSSWYAGVAYARLRIEPWLYAAARGDYFHETVPAGASPIFWAGSRWVTEGTLTLDARPADTISVRVEVRHDQAQAPLYFQGAVATDPDGDFIPDARSQNTVTVGAVAWF